MNGPARTWLTIVAMLSLGALLGNACSASGKASTDGVGGGVGPSGPGAGAGSGTGGSGGEPIFSNGSSTTGTGQEEDSGSCVSIGSEAQSQIQPADIIIAVDTSGSMDEESGQVQQNLNNFATIITNSGIDVHVILIADGSVCIPPPLGAGPCGGADEKLPNYRHVVTGVGSTDALQIILSTYPQWKSSLRANATKTIAVVTDDDSDMGAAAFTSALLAIDPPTFQGFKFDGIVSSMSPDSCIFGGCIFNCVACANPCCDKLAFCSPLSAAEGTVYKQLVMQTNGVLGDLCAQNFAPVFADMATSVVQSSQLSCEYDIPAPPDGGVLDPTKVNVAYTPGGSSVSQPILYVPGGLADCGQLGGFYYDNPQSPTKIIICPSTCAAIQSDPNGKIEVLFGCQTQIKPPE